MTAKEEAKRRAFIWIDETREGLTDFLTEYVQHKSINPTRALDFESGGTTECQRWLSGYLSSLGCFDRVELIQAGPDDFNVVATMHATSAESFRSILFNGHSDVVPVTEQEYEQWVGGDPWSGHVEDGLLYGRGASDMKGGNAAVIWAMNALASIGFVPPGQVIATFIIGEESGEVELGPHNVLKSGYGADIAVVAEATDLVVCPAAVGWFFFRVDVLGEAAHAAGRVRAVHPSSDGVIGVNAIELMGRIMSRLRDLEQGWGLYEKHPLMTPGTMGMNPVHIAGGGMQATTPDACSVIWAVTLSPNRTCADVIAEIERVIRTVEVGDVWLSAHPPVVTFPYLHTYYDPIDISVDHPATLALLKAVTDSTVTGRGIGMMPTPSDANLFAAAGQPSLVCGPGRLVGTGVHGLNERIEIEDVVQAAKSYVGMILEWCSQRREESSLGGPPVR
jgi:acetylornithine deacetylase/succinyl-diaminopimelate desuccinylase-like protein